MVKIMLLYTEYTMPYVEILKWNFKVADYWFQPITLKECCTRCSWRFDSLRYKISWYQLFSWFDFDTDRVWTINLMEEYKYFELLFGLSTGHSVRTIWNNVRGVRKILWISMKGIGGVIEKHTYVVVRVQLVLLDNGL